MEVTVEGMVMVPRDEGMGSPNPSIMRNMLLPITVRPETNVTSLNEEQGLNAKLPIKIDSAKLK